MNDVVVRKNKGIFIHDYLDNCHIKKSEHLVATTMLYGDLELFLSFYPDISDLSSIRV
jgi:hypothetical protein